MKIVRILLTGGGTGGHIRPLILVAKELKKMVGERGLEIDLKYIGPGNDFEDLLKKEGVAISRIVGAKLRRYFSIYNFIDIPKFLFAFFQSLGKVFWFKPGVVFSKGGTGSLPVLLACKFFNVPIIIHESDSAPGLTNKIAARWAKIIELGFVSAKTHFEKNTKAKINVTGNPVAEELLKPIDQKQARRFFNLDPDKKTILIMGGSQGSRRINEFILENLENLLEKYQIIHQVGEHNFLNYELGIRNNEKKLNGYYFTDYLNKNLADAYAAADVVVGRAGAQTIFELAALGKPAILIPLPESAQDHQRKNAYEYAQTGGAIVVEEKDFLADLFESALDAILKNNDKLLAMAKSAKGFYKPKAAEEIVRDILRAKTAGTINS